MAWRQHRECAAQQLIVVGGYDEAWRSLRTTEIFDPATGEWSAGPSIDSTLSFVGSARVDGTHTLPVAVCVRQVGKLQLTEQTSNSTNRART
jgi:hypothetical protein